MNVASRKAGMKGGGTEPVMEAASASEACQEVVDR